jgi:hypothetical protein
MLQQTSIFRNISYAMEGLKKTTAVKKDIRQLSCTCLQRKVLKWTIVLCKRILSPVNNTTYIPLTYMHMCTKCIKYVLNMHWICIEYVLNMYWICIEYVLNMYWICIEYVLNMYWICIELCNKVSDTLDRRGCRQKLNGNLWSLFFAVILRRRTTPFSRLLYLPDLERWADFSPDSGIWCPRR